jgi:hypothetical protein
LGFITLCNPLLGVRSNHLDAKVVLVYWDVETQVRVARVYTHRLRVVTTIAEMMRGLDPVAASVVSSMRQRMSWHGMAL